MYKKIIFMGTPAYATVIFERLLEENYNIQALFTQPDKKVGRKQILTPPHIKQFAIGNGLSLPIYQPNSLKDMATINNIKNLKPDFIIVAAYGQILPQAILDIAPCINLHASLLPLYRGASPIQQCLLNQDEFTGVTAMFMEAGLDSGDVLGLQYLKITKDMDVEYLFDKLAYIASDIIIDVLNNFKNIKPKIQNLTKVSHCGKIKKEDGLVDFNNAVELSSKYKAFKFWPGVFLESGLKLKELGLNENSSINKIGEILEIQNDYIIVGCQKGSILLKTLQQPSKRAMDVGSYIRGKRLEIGNIIS
ncbi:MAG: methionyl-tRNA formyltransferase [Arcobacteraceae bacterium]|nr:methionyl-tRNA formyltransferase [Arcobacteraceae bacterium]